MTMPRLVVLAIAPMVVVAVVLALARTGEARIGEAEEDIDLSGDWGISLVAQGPPETVTHCAAFASQMDEAIQMAMACTLGDLLGSGRFAGTIDPAGAVSFSGSIGSIPVSMEGQHIQPAEEPAYLEGTWDRGVFSATEIPGVILPWGDADCDSGVTAIDALFVLHVNADVLANPPACMPVADSDVDGVIDAMDARLILQTAAGLLTRLPIL